jgi:hypothetical protein
MYQSMASRPRPMVSSNILGTSVVRACILAYMDGLGRFVHGRSLCPSGRSHEDCDGTSTRDCPSTAPTQHVSSLAWHVSLYECMHRSHTVAFQHGCNNTRGDMARRHSKVDESINTITCACRLKCQRCSNFCIRCSLARPFIRKSSELGSNEYILTWHGHKVIYETIGPRFVLLIVSLGGFVLSFRAKSVLVPLPFIFVALLVARNVTQRWYSQEQPGESAKSVNYRAALRNPILVTEPFLIKGTFGFLYGWLALLTLATSEAAINRHSESISLPVGLHLTGGLRKDHVAAMALAVVTLAFLRLAWKRQSTCEALGLAWGTLAVAIEHFVNVCDKSSHARRIFFNALAHPPGKFDHVSHTL